MATDIRLYVLGLSVVQEKDSSYYVSTIVPPLETEEHYGGYVPEHRTFLGVMARDIKGKEGSLPAIDKLLDYNHVPKHMCFMELSLKSKVVLEEPDGPGEQDLPKRFPPVTMENLGFDVLKKDVGNGTWVPGEHVRFELPDVREGAGWGEKLGHFNVRGNLRAVADLFFWTGLYKETCGIQVKTASTRGKLLLEGTTDVRVICVPPSPVVGGYGPFGHSHALARLGTSRSPNWQKPGRFAFFHAASGSCPPISGP